MSGEGEHDSSRPPPSRPQSAPDWAVERAAEAKRVSREAIIVATEARDAARRIEGVLGQSPDPALGIEGSGLVGSVAQVLARIESWEAAQKKREELEAAVLAAEEAKRARRGAIGKTVATVIGTAATVLGIAKAIGGGGHGP